jgi:hypothetical protein
MRESLVDDVTEPIVEEFNGWLAGCSRARARTST